VRKETLQAKARSIHLRVRQLADEGREEDLSFSIGMILTETSG